MTQKGDILLRKHFSFLFKRKKVEPMEREKKCLSPSVTSAHKAVPSDEKKPGLRTMYHVLRALARVCVWVLVRYLSSTQVLAGG